MNKQCAKFQCNVMLISVFKTMLKIWSKLYFFTCCVSFSLESICTLSKNVKYISTRCESWEKSSQNVLGKQLVHEEDLLPFPAFVPSQGHYVFTVFRLLTDFVCLYNYEFWLSLCKIVRSSVILLLPLLWYLIFRDYLFISLCYTFCLWFCWFCIRLILF